MLGQMVLDPEGIEGEIPALPGLGLLDITTTMTAEKETRQVEFTFHGVPCRGYEIHQGRSTTTQQILEQGNCLGTYLHGFLDNRVVIDYLLQPFTTIRSATPQLTPDQFKDQQYDLLAQHVRQYVDIPKLYQILSHD